MMKRNSTEVILADTRLGIAPAVSTVFEHFGGGGKLLCSSRDVYIKVNAVGLESYVYTDPEVLRQTIIYFQKCGARTIYVIENCTQANFTRLVFQAIGYLKICKETGAIPVFLDETPAIPIFLEGIEGALDFLFGARALVCPHRNRHGLQGIRVCLVAARGRVPQLGDEPPDSPSRPAERVPSHDRVEGAVDLRSQRRRDRHVTG